MKKLNIAIVCDGVTSTTAGSFISTLRFSEILRKRGHKVIFITSKNSGEKNISYHNKIKVSNPLAATIFGSSCRKVPAAKLRGLA